MSTRTSSASPEKPPVPEAQVHPFVERCRVALGREYLRAPVHEITDGNTFDSAYDFACRVLGTKPRIRHAREGTREWLYFTPMRKDVVIDWVWANASE